MTSPATITNALQRMAEIALQTPRDDLNLLPCNTHHGNEEPDINIDYGLINRSWMVWCNCGKGSDAHASLRDAVTDWNGRNSDGN